MKNKVKSIFLISVLLCLGTRAEAQVTAGQLDRIASNLLTVNNICQISQVCPRGDIAVNAQAAFGTAAIRWSGNFGRISVDPVKMRQYSLNTWAFIIGHELAHQILGHIGGSAANEFQADVFGAKMAVAAGYNVRSYIQSLYRQPNACSRSHGCFHDRARNLEREFGLWTGSWRDKHRYCTPARNVFPPAYGSRQRELCIN